MRRSAKGAVAACLAVTAAVAAACGQGIATDSGGLAAVSAGRSEVRPNIVMIVVDDMRDDDLRYMPKTRRLVGDRGVRFVNSFAPYPLCCPARASILTGQYTHNHRVFSEDPPYGFNSFDDTSTLATWLQDAGYATVIVGKYLNGYGWQPPHGRTEGKSLHYVPPGWTQWKASIENGIPHDHPDHGSTYFYYDTTLSHDGDGFDNFKGRYQTDVYATISRRIIERRAVSEQPFFLYASYTAPHKGFPIEPGDPVDVKGASGEKEDFKTPAVPDGVEGMFDDRIRTAPGADWVDPDPGDKPEYLRSTPPPNQAERDAMLELTRQRAESLHVVDGAVAQTVAALRDSGALDNSLLVFTSDNGYLLGEQGIRQGKTLPYEASLRTPLLMRGPGIPAGEVRRDPFLSIDFAPTFAELAGVTPGLPVDGTSMLTVAREGDQGWHRAVLTETGEKSVVRNTDESGQPLAVDDPGARDIRWALGIRTSRYLYVSLATGEEELYDLREDPEQYVNLVDDPSREQVLDQLRDELARMRTCDAEQCRGALPEELSTPGG